ncbi:hypothetical protein [Mesorhizobium caraganae]|uniref:hypothetical protein n=1 Tax=Mesorhizobium caraganae TaxID=483206 RepID=UPI003ECF2637
MKVLNIRRLQGSGAIARFDIEITEHLRLFSLNLKKTADGRIRAFAPHAIGRHTASFHPVLAQQITEAAVAALGATANDES